MPDKLIGVAVRGNKAHEVLAMIEQAEQRHPCRLDDHGRGTSG